MMSKPLTPIGQLQDLKNRVEFLERSLGRLVVFLTAIGIMGETDYDHCQARLSRRRGFSAATRRKTTLTRGVCRICGCSMTQACRTPEGPCMWTDETQTLCTAPKCLAAAKRPARAGAEREAP